MTQMPNDPMNFWFDEMNTDDGYFVRYNAKEAGTLGPRIVTPSTCWMMVYYDPWWEE